MTTPDWADEIAAQIDTQCVFSSYNDSCCLRHERAAGIIREAFAKQTEPAPRAAEQRGYERGKAEGVDFALDEIDRIVDDPATAKAMAEKFGDKFQSALCKARADGLREAADMLLPSNGEGLSPYSPMKFAYDDIRARAEAVEKGEG